MRILVVEDNAEEARVIARICEREGHEVDVALSPLEAVDKLRASSYALALIDYELGHTLTGVDVARHAPRGTALIMITGYDVKEMRGAIENPLKPFLEIIGKPFDNDHLKHTLAGIEKMREDTKP